jgi:crotonobetainyl-CoA:carnitine CoA-transferase CaiB-like acyl-CoA transferase
VNSLEDILAHPQIEANGLVVRRQDDVHGEIGVLGPPIQMSGTPTSFDRLAPQLGEHTDEVLREFGLSDDELDALRQAHVTTAAPRPPR